MPIVLRNLSKRYSNNQIIFDNVNLNINDGSSVALVGKSGSGKSTFLNLLSGLDTPSSGDILVNGSSIVKMHDAELSKIRRKNIGFIFQFFYLQPFLSVLENTEIAAYPDRQFKKQDRRERAKYLLSLLGLKDKIHSDPNKLSGGEAQRVAIARALMNHPNIILADEPTGNLDLENSRRIFQLLRDLHKQTKCILLIATHDQTITKYVDRTLKIEHGGIVNASF